MNKRIFSGNQTVNQHVDNVLSKLVELGFDNEATVILIGSAARNRQTSRSDTDLLVITRNNLPKWRVPINLHLHIETRQNFLNKLKCGDDFQAWAIRYGKTVFDPSKWWDFIKSNPDYYVWPNWKKKMEHAIKRYNVAVKLIEDEDFDAAEEEYLMTTSHIARALLLKDKVFPLSRPEIVEQLRLQGYLNLSQILSNLIKGMLDKKELIKIDKTLKEYIYNLSLLQ